MIPYLMLTMIERELKLKVLNQMGLALMELILLMWMMFSTGTLHKFYFFYFFFQLILFLKWNFEMSDEEVLICKCFDYICLI